MLSAGASPFFKKVFPVSLFEDNNKTYYMNLMMTKAILENLRINTLKFKARKDVISNLHPLEDAMNPENLPTSKFEFLF